MIRYNYDYMFTDHIILSKLSANNNCDSNKKKSRKNYQNTEIGENINSTNYALLEKDYDDIQR